MTASRIIGCLWLVEGPMLFWASDQCTVASSFPILSVVLPGAGLRLLLSWYWKPYEALLLSVVSLLLLAMGLANLLPTAALSAWFGQLWLLSSLRPWIAAIGLLQFGIIFLVILREVRKGRVTWT